MSRHLARRTPKRGHGLCWGRMSTSDGSVTTWRLFRRDHTGALHCEVRAFLATQDRASVARELRRACHVLRDRVDTLDLAAMGVAA